MTPTFRRLLTFLAASVFFVLMLFSLPTLTGTAALAQEKTPAKTQPADAKTGESKTGDGARTGEAKTGEAKTGEAKTGKTGEAAPPKDGRISLKDLKDGESSTSILDRLRSFLGMFVLLGICFAMSNNRKKVSWKLVGWGLGLQLMLGLLVMKTSFGVWFFQLVNDLFTSLMSCSTEGSKFLFGNLATGNNVPVGPGAHPFSPVGASGNWANTGAFFAFNVLPTIIFFSSLMAVLYHVGVMQKIVKVAAVIMQKTMGTSGSETLSAAGNIFVGQTEAPLLVRPFVSGMTQSELMAVMTGGFATVAGGVMAAYVGFLQGYFSDVAGHLLSASVMSAPAALVCAKLMVPEPVPEKSETYGELKVELEKVDANVIDAAARGAGDGLKLALNVGAMLMAFVALIFMFNALMNWTSNKFADGVYGQTWEQRVKEVRDALDSANGQEDAEVRAKDRQAVTEAVKRMGREAVGAGESLEVQVLLDGKSGESTLSESQLVVSLADLEPKAPGVKGIVPLVKSESKFRHHAQDTSWEVTFRSLRLEMILGWLLAPLAWIMGVPWGDAKAVGQLIGMKTVVNEFVAYLQLGEMLKGGAITHYRSKVIVLYALCGFANFSSIAIQIGGIGGIAPDRRQDLARIGLKAMICGTIAALLTATVAGILV